MLSDNENSNLGDDEATECNTGVDETPLKKRGRPKGSKNRLTAEARGVLAKHGLAGLRQLCAIAAGRPVYRPRSSGERQMLMPNLDQMLTAQKAIVDRLVPQLKATELTGAEGAPLIPTDADTKSIANAVLNFARDRLVTEKAQKDGPLKPTEVDPMLSLNARHWAAPPVPENASSDVPAGNTNAIDSQQIEKPAAPAREFKLGEREVYDNGAWIEFVEISGSNAKKWAVYDGAGHPHGYKFKREDAEALAESLPTVATDVEATKIVHRGAEQRGNDELADIDRVKAHRLINGPKPSPRILRSPGWRGSA